MGLLHWPHDIFNFAVILSLTPLVGMGDKGGQAVAEWRRDREAEAPCMGFEGMPGFQRALRVWWKPLRGKEEVRGTDRARLGHGDEGRHAWGRSSGRASRVF